jgi:hypothetical protein
LGRGPRDHRAASHVHGHLGDALIDAGPVGCSGSTPSPRPASRLQPSGLHAAAAATRGHPGPGPNRPPHDSKGCRYACPIRPCPSTHKASPRPLPPARSTRAWAPTRTAAGRSLPSASWPYADPKGRRTVHIDESLLPPGSTKRVKRDDAADAEPAAEDAAAARPASSAPIFHVLTFAHVVESHGLRISQTKPCEQTHVFRSCVS